MARKAKARMQTSFQGGQRSEEGGARRRRRMKWLAGGAVLVLVLGIGGVIRWRQQRDVLVQLQSLSSSRYTRGPTDAPVVIKEFSDYT